jgi:hypothetical protein
MKIAKEIAGDQKRLGKEARDRSAIGKPIGGSFLSVLPYATTDTVTCPQSGSLFLPNPVLLAFPEG